ncbi:MAG: AmmeMemoRadiSam system protein B [Deltaproteobacteria bacterium]|nr:AmmeMemoRadiSam system protein B [Deltaproteobacteria bacterium]
MPGPVRPSPIAGSWYPGYPDILKGDIGAYLDHASIPEIPARPVAIISPHAGYVYSGPVAAHAYKTLMGYDYSTVVVISPSHRAYFPFISIWGDGAYETPLGQVPVDEELCTALVKSSTFIREEKRPHLAEHALEIQLPFLQVVLKLFKLCPVIMGQQEINL